MWQIVSAIVGVVRLVRGADKRESHPAFLSKLIEVTVPGGRSFAIEFCDTVRCENPDDHPPAECLAETTVCERGWARRNGAVGNRWFPPHSLSRSENVASTVFAGGGEDGCVG